MVAVQPDHTIAVLSGLILHAYAYKVGVKNFSNGVSAKAFTRQQPDRLGLDQKLKVIPWGSKKVKLPPSKEKKMSGVT